MKSLVSLTHHQSVSWTLASTGCNWTTEFWNPPSFGILDYVITENRFVKVTKVAQFRLDLNIFLAKYNSCLISNTSWEQMVSYPKNLLLGKTSQERVDSYPTWTCVCSRTRCLVFFDSTSMLELTTCRKCCVQTH